MPSSTAGPAPGAPPAGRRYDVAGRSLALHHAGRGGPPVVWLPGAGLVGLDFLTIHERVAERTTSVIYDRAGTGWSESVPLPRTAADVAAELRALLDAAGVPGPYVLAGHSLGGAYARHFAACFPADVAGLLLLDPFHEDMAVRAPEEVRARLAEMRAKEWPEPTGEQLDAARAMLRRHFAAWPDVLRGPLVEYHLGALLTGTRESENLYDEVAGELRALPDPPDVPAIVISALGHDATQAALWSEPLLRRINEGKRALHAELAAEFPRGEHRVVEDAGHGWLHLENAGAVRQAVADLLGRQVRARRRSGRASSAPAGPCAGP